MCSLQINIHYLPQVKKLLSFNVTEVLLEDWICLMRCKLKCFKPHKISLQSLVALWTIVKVVTLVLPMTLVEVVLVIKVEEVNIMEFFFNIYIYYSCDLKYFGHFLFLPKSQAPDLHNVLCLCACSCFVTDWNGGGYIFL